MAPFSYARRTILWCHNMVPFNGAILWHVCTRLYAGLDIVVSDYFVVFWLWFDVSNDLGCVAVILCLWP